MHTTMYSFLVCLVYRGKQLRTEWPIFGKGFGAGITLVQSNDAQKHNLMYLSHTHTHTHTHTCLHIQSHIHIKTDSYRTIRQFASPHIHQITPWVHGSIMPSHGGLLRGHRRQLCAGSSANEGTECIHYPTHPQK